MSFSELSELKIKHYNQYEESQDIMSILLSTHLAK